MAAVFYFGSLGERLLYVENPWLKLPDKPDYILPDDLEHLRHHRNLMHLKLGSMPGQFAGGLDNARVVLLALNPGYSERDVTVDLQIPEFKYANLNNHIDPYGSSFYYFGGGLSQTAGYEWWSRILRFLLREGVTEQAIREKLMLVEYFPYHSLTWKPLPTIPSQQFAFNIVREAIERNKIIVIMRSAGLWYEAVSGLSSYANKMVIKNPRQPYISIGNLGNDNFNSIVAELV